MKRISLLIFLLTILFVNGQQEIQITGTVTDSLGKQLPYIDVLLKKKDSTKSILAYAITDDYGEYKIIYQTNQDTLILETSSLTYKKTYKTVYISKGTKKISENFILLHRIEELQEVEVTAAPRIQVRNDTTIFNINLLKDGSERVVEELLQKLPGIVINESGKIKFKGKDVGNVLLDGENLFNGNYTVGTKNINANHIKGIEAIENFEDNPLLQGLSQNDEVALNLKFGTGLSFSGNLELAYAEKDKNAVNTKAIAISKKVKSFLIGSYNSIGNGTNGQEFDVPDYVQGLIGNIRNEQSPSYIFDSNNLFPVGNIVSNNQFFGSLNFLPKLSKTETLRLNVDLFSDRILDQLSSTTIFGNETANFIQVDQSNSSTYRPFLGNINVLYQRFFSEKSAWKTNVKVLNIRNDVEKLGVRNNQKQEENSLYREFFIKSNTEFTKRINDTNAIKAEGLFLFDERPENLILLSDLNLFENLTNDNSVYNQEVYSNKIQSELSLRYLKRGDRNKLNLKGNLLYFRNKLTSNLLENDSTLSNNNIKYEVFLPEITVDYFFENEKFEIRPILKAKIYDYDYTEELNFQSENSTLLFDAFLKIDYKLNRRNDFYFEYKYLNNIPREENLYANLILRSNRVLQNNELNFTKLESNNVRFLYSYKSLNNNTDIRFSFDYNKKNNDYLIANIIDSNTSISTNILQNSASENRIWNMSLVKYVSFLRSTFRLQGVYNNSNYFNFFNNTDLRFNKNKTLNTTLSVGTSFIGKFLFGNNVIYSNSNITSVGFNSIENTNLTNNFNVSYVFNERLRADALYNFNLPNINDFDSNTSSIDLSVNFKNKRKTISYGLEGRNLLNQSNLLNIQNTDFSSTITSESLFNRIILLKLDFKF